MPSETGWGIAGQGGLYVDWRHTRRDMIAKHVSDLFSGSPEFGEVSPFVTGGKLNRVQRLCWDRCKQRGDRVTKVRITYK